MTSIYVIPAGTFVYVVMPKKIPMNDGSIGGNDWREPLIRIPKVTNITWVFSGSDIEVFNCRNHVHNENTNQMILTYIVNLPNNEGFFEVDRYAVERV